MKLEDENESALCALVKSQGLTVYDPTQAEMAEWRKAGQSIWSSMPGGQAVIEKIKAAVK